MFRPGKVLAHSQNHFHRMQRVAKPRVISKAKIGSFKTLQEATLRGAIGFINGLNNASD